MAILGGLMTRATSYFGSPIAAKAILIGGAVGVTLIGSLCFALWWLYDDLGEANEANGGLKQAVLDLQGNIKTQNQTIRNMKADAAKKDSMHKEELRIQAETADRALETQRLLFETKINVSKVYNDDPEAKAWADSPIPANVLACLQQGNCAATNTGARGTNPENGVCDGLSGPDEAVPKTKCRDQDKR
jgi:hypothetical protein